MADLDAQLTSRQHRLVSATLQYGYVEKRIARAVPQLDESKTLFGIEPFDGSVYRWARRDRIRARRSLK
jgi:hypothetical protein